MYKIKYLHKIVLVMLVLTGNYNLYSGVGLNF